MKNVTQLSDEELLAQLKPQEPSELQNLSDAELVKQLSIAPEPSVKTQGISYFKEHPFKAILEPPTKTITGKSMEERGRDNIIGDFTPQQAEEYKKQWGTYPEFLTPNQRGILEPGNIDKQPLKKAALLTKAYLNPTLGRLGDQVTPASFIPIPGANAAGKIPVGSTNVGRIASNVAVGKGFMQGIKDLQALETHLQKIGQLSSPGIKTGLQYNPAVNEAVVAAHNAINTPTAGTFKQKGQFAVRDKKLVEGYQTINEFAGAEKPKTIDETLNTINNAKSEVYKAYSTQAKQASKEGATVDLAAVANSELRPLLKNEQIITHRKNLLKPVEDYIENFTRRGKVSIEEAQKDLETLNSDIGRYIKSGSPDDQNLGAVKLAISKSIRNQADDAIQEALGKGGYQTLRGKYGAVKAVEDELLKAYAKQMKPKTGISGPILDVMTGTDLTKALMSTATGNPVEAGRNLVGAAANQIVKKTLAARNSPDKKIVDIFKAIEKSKVGPKEKKFILPSRGKNEGQPVAKNLQDNPDLAGAGEVFRDSNIAVRPTTEKPTLLLPKPNKIYGDNFVTNEGAPAQGATLTPNMVSSQPAQRTGLNEFGKQEALRIQQQQEMLRIARENQGRLASDAQRGVKKYISPKSTKPSNRPLYSSPDTSPEAYNMAAEGNPNVQNLAVAGAAGLGASLILPRGAEASQKTNIADKDAIKSILGEAEDQGPDGMKMVASAIRNRGNLKGVYGHAAIIEKDGEFYRRSKNKLRKLSKSTVQDAKEAWKVSKGQDFAKGATHWEGTKFKKPEWAKNMDVAIESKSQRFYRARKPRLILTSTRSS